jgi:hypothetical protein|nr:MAG TPA: Protein of unknown function (DUF551) [Caudoviricetes sp.]
MQELEKILEEIDKEIAKERAICEDLEDTPGWRLYEKTMNRAKDIIRKHMNDGNDINVTAKDDGWIPVEKRLPEKKDVYLVTYHPCYWDNVHPDIAIGIDTFRGKTTWAKKKFQKVIAWKPLPEPYRPERRKDGQAD